MAEEELKNKIEELKDELKNTKVNKRTEGAVGQLKAKIAKFEAELEVKLSKGKGGGVGFAVKKEGNCTIGFLGKPSVGKSTLLGSLTNKESKIGAYEFTTLDCIPGLMNYKHTDFQILDLPGIIDRASDNRGFGKKVLSVVRICDLVILVVDCRYAIDEIKMLINETYNSKIRLNKKIPNASINKTSNGNINIIVNKSNLSKDFINEVLKNNKIINCEVLINEMISEDEFLDVVYKNVEYKKCAICLNKIDLLTFDELKYLKEKITKLYPKFSVFGLSAEKKINLEKFKEFLFYEMDFIYVYLKEQKKKPDFQKPLVIKKNSTIKDVLEKLHQNFSSKFKYAIVNGENVKFENQRVGLNYIVSDKDIVEFYMR